jgi:hypothetical protein
MSDHEWAEIERRADLWLTFGDRDAFRADDLTAMLAEVRGLRALRTRLIALNKQMLTRLGDPAEPGHLEPRRPALEPTAIIPPGGRRL